MDSFIEIPTANYQNQRVGLFLDVQNLYYSAKALFSSRVNFDEILRASTANRKLIRAIAYVIQTEVGDEKTFFEALSKMGFELRAKDLQVFYGGNKKGDWDVGIAMDIMRLASKLDVVVLGSGDGDFTDLLTHSKALGCRTEVIAFKKSASSKLIEAADSFIDLGNERFLIPSKKVAKQVKASSKSRAPQKRTSKGKSAPKKRASTSRTSQKRSTPKRQSRPRQAKPQS